MDHMPVLTGSQLKLCALMVKASELINFASDDECDIVFLGLTHFGKMLLQSEQQAVENRQLYGSMTLEALISVAMPVAPAVPALVKRQLHIATSLTPSKRARDPPTFAVASALNGPGPVHWDFVTSPIVVTVQRIDHTPLLIVFTVRSASMVLLSVFADLPKLRVLLCFDHKKSSKNENALQQLKKAIIAYSRAKPLSRLLRTPLYALPWASKSFWVKLHFEER